MKAISGWKLTEESRTRLMARYPPSYPEVVADHVTLEAHNPDPPLPPAVTAQVVGVADDGAGVQALVVSLDGDTRRPDGSTYHITWSLDKAAGRRAVQSNDVIRTRGWTAHEPIAIMLTPAVWRS